MRRILKAAGWGLVLVIAGLCLLSSLVPPFLDRIYYRGPVSNHFDGSRFFNPEDAGDTEAGARRRGNFLLRMARGQDRAEWPERVSVTPTVPPRRVAGSAMRVTWIGHATVLVQTAGLNILTDPIWSERASPVSFAGPRRVRAPGIRFEDLPPIDLVLVSHNHYDHMDVATLQRLWRRDRPLIVTSLGNDTILRSAGIGGRALDWRKAARLRPGVEVTVARNHHWGSRWFTDRNRALWSAFVVRLPGGNIFFAGDTGFGDGEWVEEAAVQGPYRLAILPIGAYAPRDVMKKNHIDPDEAVKVFEALRPARALGIHWGTFQLTFEPIEEPRQRLAAALRRDGLEAGHFLATEVGQSFEVPAIAR